MNRKYTGIMVVIMLIISATFLPGMQGSKGKSILESQIIVRNKTGGDILLSYLKQINDQDFTYKEDVFKEVQNYLSIDKDTEYSLFMHLCNRLQKNMGREPFNEFMSFMLGTFQYLNANEMNIEDLNELLYGGIEAIQTDFISPDNGSVFTKEVMQSNQYFFNLYNSEETCCISLGSDFENYWNRYGKAKCYWDGYMPSKTGEPGKLMNVNKIIGLWSGENFYEWHQNAVDYIIGLDENTGKAPFVQIMNLGISISLILLAISFGMWISGFFSGNANWILTGGGFALFGLFAASFTAAYLYMVLYYFLYGSNAYFEMQRFGNVDFIVHVIDETGSAITSDISVVAKSADALGKYDNDEPVYPGFPDVTWSDTEFEYDLARVTDQHGNEEPGTFCLHGAQESPEKWKKSVPPPGNWIFVVVDENGYEHEPYTLEKEIGPGECFDITIQLNEK